MARCRHPPVKNLQAALGSCPLNAPATGADGITRLSETDGRFANWMAAHGAHAVVVRPDRYVYGVATDAAQLKALVERLHMDLLTLPAGASAALNFR